MDTTIYEYRKDGWPLCPRCGEDELWSRVGFSAPVNKRPELADYFVEPFRCYRCNWRGKVPMQRVDTT